MEVSPPTPIHTGGLELTWHLTQSKHISILKHPLAVQTTSENFLSGLDNKIFTQVAKGQRVFRTSKRFAQKSDSVLKFDSEPGEEDITCTLRK